MRFLSENATTAFVCLALWSALACRISFALGRRKGDRPSGRQTALLYLVSVVAFYLMLRGLLSFWG